MTPDWDAYSHRLEDFWTEPSGFLFRLRRGDFDANACEGVLEFLRSLPSPSDDDLLPRRFVALTWYIPGFMEWQVDRVREHGGDIAALHHAIDNARTAVQRILGVP